MHKNTLSLDFRDNPDLKAALAGLEPGDSVTLEIDVTVKSVDDDFFESDIDSITTESEGDAIPTDVDAPVTLVMIGGKKKKPRSMKASKSSSDAEDTSSDDEEDTSNSGS